MAFFRLAKVYEHTFNVEGYSYRSWYSLQYFIVPLTGWSSNFKYFGNPKYLRISSKVVDK